MRKSTKIASITATVAAMSLALSGCSASAEQPAGTAPAGEAPASTEAVDLKVGYIPVGIYSYFWRAEDAGYFDDENLNVELMPMAGGGEIIPALQSGTLQFGISDALGVLNARNQGIDVSYVSFNFSQDSSDPVHSVVTADDTVRSPKDLEGKTVATNLSYNTDWTMMREWLRQNDVDLDSVTFQELPFPDMLSALRSGTVAAAGMTEPFVTVADTEGLRVLGNYFTDVKSPITLSGVAATASYISENEGVVERFVKAINRAIDDFNTDSNITRSTIKEHTKIDPEVVDKMNLGKWTTTSNLDDIKFWVSAAEAEGILENKIDPAELLWAK